MRKGLLLVWIVGIIVLIGGGREFFQKYELFDVGVLLFIGLSIFSLFAIMIYIKRQDNGTSVD